MMKKIINYILSLFGVELTRTEEKTIKQVNFYCKKRIMSTSEIKFYNLLKDVLEGNYIIWPQVNLAAVVDKNPHYHYSNNYRKFQNELFRNVDFGIFDKDTFELKLLIELNDQSHNKPNRKKRDEKVKLLCNKCGYNLITFWLNKPNEPSYVKNRILYYLGALDQQIDSTQELHNISNI